MLMVSITLRGSGRKLYSGSADCMLDAESGVMRCFSGICDGGFVLPAKAADGRLKLTIPDHFALTGCDGDEETAVSIGPSSDDAAFLLDPVPAAQCSTTYVERARR
jgi:hypothetical protein